MIPFLGGFQDIGKGRLTFPKPELMVILKNSLRTAVGNVSLWLVPILPSVQVPMDIP
jgi:hypothetical protein